MKTATLSIIENAFIGAKPHEATFTMLTLEDGSAAPLGRFERVAVQSKAAALEWANANSITIKMLGVPNFDGSGKPITGRYYVYQDSFCLEWLEYGNLSDAKAENPGKWVMDSTTKEAVPETRA